MVMIHSLYPKVPSITHPDGQVLKKTIKYTLKSWKRKLYMVLQGNDTFFKPLESLARPRNIYLICNSLRQILSSTAKPTLAPKSS
jgi:hypothetical protein